MNSPSFLSTPFSLPIDAFTILVASVVLVVSGTTTGGHHDNLITNSSFEQPMAGVPTIPDQWSVRFVDRGDHVQRVSDPTWAHRGRACVRLSSIAGDGITLDALPASGIEFRPGDPYTVTVWARKLGATNPVMIVEPGRGQFELTEEWKSYQTSYVHPADAAPQLGFLVRIRDGTALIDDVAIVPSGIQEKEPPELQSDRSKVRDLPVSLAWRNNADEPRWTQRTVIKTTELMGEMAEEVTVRLRLCDLLPDKRYDKISPSVFKVIDGNFGKEIPHALLNADSFAGPSAMDVLAIRVNCPPKTSATYFVYFSPQAFKEEQTWPTELPSQLAGQAKYRHQLEVEVGSVEHPVDVCVDPDGEAYQLRVETLVPGPATAVLLPPTGASARQWEFGEQGGLIHETREFNLAGDAAVGVWKIEVKLPGGEGRDDWVAHSCFVHGNAMWWANNADTLDPRRQGPRHDAEWIQLAAARNERESFQLAIESSAGLRGVGFGATELTHTLADEVIPAEQVTFQYVEQVNIAIPHPRGAAPGWYGDPLVPWRTREIPAGSSVTAWVTVNVDRNVVPGEYQGHVIATASDGTLLTLPLQVEVFDFTLPDELTMKTVLGGDIWQRVTKGIHHRRTNSYRDIHDGGTAMALAELLAGYHATPFYYHHDKSPYAVPWHYDPESGTAKFDFSQLDRNAAIMMDEWDQDFLFFGGKFAGGWRRPGTVYDWHRDIAKARTAMWEVALAEHRFTRDTAEGQRMYAAYCRGIAEHLEQMGWIDQSIIYLTDEDETDEVRQVAMKMADIVKQANPRLKSLILSNASYRYPDYLDRIDFFGGPITPEHRQRFERHGGQWWGAYNAGGFPTTPLSYTRALGARNWLDRSQVYLNWAIWRNPDALVDVRQHWPLVANAGYATGVFVQQSRTDSALWGTWAYPWPAWEPLPDDTQQDLFIGSLRLEALREAVEDYEYFKLAEELANRQRPDAQGERPAALLLDQLRKFVDDSHTRIHKFSYFDVDPEKYHQLRCKIGRMLGR